MQKKGFGQRGRGSIFRVSGCSIHYYYQVSPFQLLKMTAALPAQFEIQTTSVFSVICLRTEEVEPESRFATEEVEAEKIELNENILT